MRYIQIWQNFRGNEDVWKLGKKYINDLLFKVGPSSLQHSEFFWHITCFSTGNCRKVINIQTSLIFWPTLYIQLLLCTVNDGQLQTVDANVNAAVAVAAVH